MKEYHNEIKKISENFKIEKKHILEKQKVEINREKLLKEKIRKDEIKNKLPLVVKRQKEAGNQFIQLYKQKENMKEEYYKVTYTDGTIEYWESYDKLEIERLSKINPVISIILVKERK
jgi:hypothetical protein